MAEVKKKKWLQDDIWPKGSCLKWQIFIIPTIWKCNKVFIMLTNCPRRRKWLISRLFPWNMKRDKRDGCVSARLSLSFNSQHEWSSARNKSSASWERICSLVELDENFATMQATVSYIWIDCCSNWEPIISRPTMRGNSLLGLCSNKNLPVCNFYILVFWMDHGH